MSTMNDRVVSTINKLWQMNRDGRLSRVRAVLLLRTLTDWSLVQCMEFLQADRETAQTRAQGWMDSLS